MNWKYAAVLLLFTVVVAGIARPVYAQTSCRVHTYSIGVVDARFGISSTTLANDLASAESIWETPAHHELFMLVPTGGDITVDLIYDSRQAATIALRAREEKLHAIKTVFGTLQDAFQKVVDETQSDMRTNAARFTEYMQDLNTFNVDVARVNARGGATSAEAQDFESRKVALEKKFAASKVVEQQLNARIESINALSLSLNKVVELLNGFVKQHNDALAQVGEFEEGYYKRVGTIESIGIYSFADQQQFTRVLAHEFGHALGMQHVSDPDAIMYQVNKGTSLVPTMQDLEELSKICGKGI